MKHLALMAVLLLAACEKHPASWDMVHATYAPQRVSGSDNAPSVTR